MKSISSEMRTHLNGRVTSLASIWRITRTDGEEFFFTDHDKDIVFDAGDGAKTYKASSGYKRTAARMQASLAADTIDVLGFFSTGDVEKDDIKAGLFDFAECRLSLVNWADPSMGAIKIRRGWLGEVTLTDKGMFSAELRSLSQILDQQILTTYQAECRAHLGDTKCKYPIYPDVLTREKAVTVGEFYRVPTKDPGSLTWANLIYNGRFEIDAPGTELGVGEITGWTWESGVWDIVTTRDGLNEHEGEQFLAGSVSSASMSQTVNLVSAGVSATDIDAGSVTTTLAMQRANSDTLDTGRIRLDALDVDEVLISNLYDSTEESVGLDAWTARGVTGALLPVGCRYLRLRLSCTKVSGATASVGFDSIVLSLTDSDGTNTYQELYENRVYEVTTAGTTDASQPTYDETVGNPTTDGDAVLTCRASKMLHGWILGVSNSRTVEIVLADAPPADDWFKYGALVMENGPAPNRGYEIRGWSQMDRTLTLFLRLPVTVPCGTRIRLHQGCDKRFETCIDTFDNVVNFRGDPFIPGKDEFEFKPSPGGGSTYRTTPLRRGTP